MSGFNHDAAMRRGAERQKAVESASNEVYDFVDRQEAIGHNEALVRLSSAILTIILERQNKGPLDMAFDPRLRRKAEILLDVLAKKSQSTFESDAMALTLAKQLLESGTSKILSDVSTWESETFRED
jgi:hypothetical protein